MIKLTKWLWDSDIPLLQKIKYEYQIWQGKRKEKQRQENYRKWIFIRDTVLEYYNLQPELQKSPVLMAKEEMEERIKTVKELKFWYKRALKWRKEQWKLA